MPVPLASIACRAAADALDRQLDVVQRAVRVARGVLDREPGDARAGRATYVLRDLLGLDRVAALEVGVDRDRHGRRDGAQVVEGLVERDAVVGPTGRPGEAGARRRQGREAELLQGACAPDVPRVRHDEAAGGVQACGTRRPGPACAVMAHLTVRGPCPGHDAGHAMIGPCAQWCSTSSAPAGRPGGPRPGPGRARRRRPGRGDRAVPQRLARLGRPRPDDRPPARARPRAGRPRARRRGGGHQVAARRPGHRPVRLRLRQLRAVPHRQPPGLRAPDPAGVHRLGLLRRAASPSTTPTSTWSRCRTRSTRSTAAGARLPGRHRAPRRRGAGPGAAGAVGRGARVRRGGPVRRDGRGRGRGAGRGGRRRTGRPRAGPRVRGGGHRGRARARTSSPRCARPPVAAPTCPWTRSAATTPAPRR